MQTVMNTYRGLGLLIGLNWDRLFVIATVWAGLFAGAALGSYIAQ
jgi:hypothetical protein